MFLFDMIEIRLMSGVPYNVEKHVLLMKHLSIKVQVGLGRQLIYQFFCRANQRIKFVIYDTEYFLSLFLRYENKKKNDT